MIMQTQVFLCCTRMLRLGSATTAVVVMMMRLKHTEAKLVFSKKVTFVGLTMKTCPCCMLQCACIFSTENNQPWRKRTNIKFKLSNIRPHEASADVCALPYLAMKMHSR